MTKRLTREDDPRIKILARWLVAAGSWGEFLPDTLANWAELALRELDDAKPARLPGELKTAKATDVVGTLGSEGYMIIQHKPTKRKRG